MKVVSWIYFTILFVLADWPVCCLDLSQPKLPSDLSNANISENGTKIESNDTQNVVPSEEEESKGDIPIAPFDEWTKEKLKEQEQKHHHHHLASPPPAVKQENGRPQNGHPSEHSSSHSTNTNCGQGLPVATIPDRNYASKECGAKVLIANPEAENNGALIKDKDHDDYMRNPCDTGVKYFVLELCETIQPTLIELANLELFSSGPKDFKAFGSERFPSNDWTPLGEWNAEDVRSIQTFNVNKRSYVKFLKIELLSHYGSEHYCTLSVVRVYGVSMVDEYEAAAEADAMTQPHVIHEQDTKATEAPPAPTTVAPVVVAPTDSNVTTNKSLEKQQHNIVGAVKDAVKGVFNGVSQLLGSKKSEQAVQNKTDCDWFFFKTNWKYRSHRCLICHREPKRKTSKFCHYFAPRPKEHIVTIRPAIKPPKNITKVFKKKKRRRRKDIRRSFVELIRLVANEAELKHPIIRQPPKADVNAQMLRAKDGPLPGTSMTQKESVFMKLNTRIKALEWNISLSGQYLSELSRKYVNQITDMQRQYNRTMRMLNESTNRATEITQRHDAEIKKLNERIDELNEENEQLKQTIIYDAPSQVSTVFDITPDTFKELQIWMLTALIIQAFIVLLAAWLCCSGPRQSTVKRLVAEELSRHVISLTANERIANGHVPSGESQSQKQVVAGTEEESCPASPELSAPSRKRRRKKVKSQPDTDSAVESRASPTPTPSELSSEVEIHEKLTFRPSPQKQRSCSADRERTNSPAWTLVGMKAKKNKIQQLNGKEIESRNRFGLFDKKDKRRPNSDIY